MLCLKDPSDTVPLKSSLVALFVCFDGKAPLARFRLWAFDLVLLGLSGFRLLSMLNGGNSCRLELRDFDRVYDSREIDNCLRDVDLRDVARFEAILSI